MNFRATLGAAVCGVLTGCASVPDNIRTPVAGTCIDIKEPLTVTDTYGLASIEQTLGLAPGLYYSEKEDDEGTYYRAPPGGLTYSRTGEESKPPGLLTHMVLNGGVWLPRDQSAKPRMYWIFATGDVAPVPQPAGTACSLAALEKAPDTTGVVPWPGMSTQVRVVGNVAPGAAIGGGAIVNGMMAVLTEREKGKIQRGNLPIPKNEAFIATLRQLGRNAVPMQPAGEPGPDGAMVK